MVGQKLKDAVKRITEFYKNNQDEVEEKIFQEITYGLQQCVQTKKKLGYIAISVLESSIITKTYDLQIAFYNKDLYADGYPVYKYWAPAFIYESLDADIEEIEALLKLEIVRLKPYEICEIKHQYAINFYFLIGFLMKSIASKITHIQMFQKVDKENEVKILFGKYMEKQIVLHILGG